MWLIYTILISFLCASIVLVSKTRELKTGQKNFVGVLLTNGDPFIGSIAKKFGGFLSHHSERTFFLFLVHLPARAEVFFRKLRSRANDYYHNISAKIRGRRSFSSEHVSPYMRSMQFRQDGESGRSQ